MVSIERLANGRFQVVINSADGFSVVWEGTSRASAAIVAARYA